MKIIKDIDAQIENLKRQKREVMANRNSALKGVVETVRDYGFTWEEIQEGISSLSSKVKKEKAPARYRKDGMEWSGKDRKPLWVIEHLNAGGSIEDLTIQ